MLSWSTIIYGAAISALLAAVAVAVVERIRPSRRVEACRHRSCCHRGVHRTPGLEYNPAPGPR